MLKNFKNFLIISYLSINLAYATEAPDLETLKNEIQKASQRVRACREGHADINSIIVIGRTGGGKSTLINHLADRPLVATRGAAGLTLDTNNPLPDFHIGGNVAVGTRVPSSWYDRVSNVVYWDCPGFADPRGAGTDIVNAFSIKQLFQSPSRVKIVIAAQENDLLFRATEFGALLKQVVETFNNSRDLESCLSLVVTRQRDVNVPEILGSIYANADQNELFRSPRVKSLVGFLRDNAGTRVSYMPYPDVTGTYVGNRVSISRNIDSTNYVLNPNFSISVPAESNLLVRQLSRRVNQGIENHVVDTISNSIERELLNIIRRHAETAVSMKARFAIFGETLGRVRNDAPQNYIQDLQLFLTSLGVLDSLDNLRRDVDIVAFFSEIVRDNLHETILWKNALENITKKIGDMSRAPTSRVNAQYRNNREDPSTWRIIREFGRNQKIWEIDLVRDVYEQDSTLFPGILEPIVDLHTFSRKEKFGSKSGERKHAGNINDFR